MINCSFKFFYEYIKKIKSNDLLYESKNAILRGSIIHKVLEFFHKKYKTYNPDKKIDLTNYLTQLSTKIFKAESGDLYQLHFEQTSTLSQLSQNILTTSYLDNKMDGWCEKLRKKAKKYNIKKWHEG